MSVSEIQSSLFRYKRPLTVLVCLAVLVCAIFLHWGQSYTAKVYIRYEGKQAQQGLTQNNRPLNPYEISDVQIVAGALARMGESNVSTSVVRSISVTPVQSLAELEKYEAWIDNFNDYEDDEAGKVFPVNYCVSFRTARGEEFAWSFLSALLEEYSAYYARTYGWHSNIAVLSEDVAGQDYWKTVQTLRGKINSVQSVLNNIETEDLNYRSARTGWSVHDLVDAFSYLEQTKLAGTEQYILEYGVSKDREVLRADLAVKADTAEQNGARSQALAQTRRTLMDKYSERNRDYLWQDSADEETIQIREDIERNGGYNEALTTYDQLMVEFVGHRIDSKNFDADTQMYREWAELFANGKDDSGTAAQRLAEICAEFESLFEITEETLEDYNLFKQARYVSQLSGIAVNETLSELICYAVSVVLSLGVGVIAVIFVELKRRGVI